MIRRKIWTPEGLGRGGVGGGTGHGAYCPYISIQKILKIFLSETTGPISILHGRNVPLVTVYQDSSSRHDSSKTWPLGVGAYFLYISI